MPQICLVTCTVVSVALQWKQLRDVAPLQVLLACGVLPWLWLHLPTSKCQLVGIVEDVQPLLLLLPMPLAILVLHSLTLRPGQPVFYSSISLHRGLLPSTKASCPTVKPHYELSNQPRGVEGLDSVVGQYDV